MGKLRWYKRDPDAALAGMIGMSLQERGAYNTILDLLYSHGGNLPDNDSHLQAAMGCHGNEWRAVKKKLLDRGKIWITPDGKLMAKRVETALKEAGDFSEKQRNRVKVRWENDGKRAGNAPDSPRKRGVTDAQKSENPNYNKDALIPIAVIPIQPQPQPEKKETPVNTDTESLIDKSLPLTTAVSQKINVISNGFNGHGNGSRMTQEQADDWASQKCVEYMQRELGIDDAWRIASIAEDPTNAEYERCCGLMREASKAANVGWVSPPYRKAKRARA